MYDWAMKCSACGEINTAEFFPNESDICVDCQGELIPDQLKVDQLPLPLGEEDKE
jgi:rRNA maturation endonuclease Nob1